MPSLNKAAGRTSYWLPLFLGFSALSLFGSIRSIGAPPLWDDIHFIVEQPWLRRPGSLGTMLSLRGLIDVLPIHNAARPVWVTSVLLDRTIFGDNFTAARLVSAIYHATAGLLLSALAIQLGLGGAAGALAGGLFVVHPIHLETVHIVTFRSDPLALIFMLISANLFLYERKSNHPKLVRAGVLAYFAVALLAKESAVVLPLLLPIIDGAAPGMRRGQREWARLFVACAVVLFGYLLFRAPRSGYTTRAGPDELQAVLREMPRRVIPARWPEDPESRHYFSKASRRDTDRDELPSARLPGLFSERARLMLAVQKSALSRLFWPVGLQTDYAAGPTPERRGTIALVAFVALLAAAVASWSIVPAAAAGLAWITVALLPTSGIIHLPNWTADRYLYVPAAGLCLAIAALVAPRATATAREIRGYLLAGLVLGAFWLLLNVHRSSEFSNNHALFTAAVKASPLNPRARVNLAIADWIAGNADAAEVNFRESLRLWPDGTFVRKSYASFLIESGRTEEAKQLVEGL